MVYDKYGKDHNNYIKVMRINMKKFLLTLICVGVIIGGIGAAVGLSVMSSRDKTGAADNSSTEARLNDGSNALSEQSALTPAPEPTPEPDRINPSTRIIYEYLYQTDGRTDIIEEKPPYFLMDLSRDKIAEYYADWDIVEFNKNLIKLRRTITESIEDHYVLGIKDSYVAVYHKSNTGNVSLKEITATPVKALSPDEQNRLMTGITIKNEEQLAKMLEDYGS